METLSFLLPVIITLLGIGITYFAEIGNYKRFAMVIVHSLLLLVLGILSTGLPKN